MDIERATLFGRSVKVPIIRKARFAEIEFRVDRLKERIRRRVGNVTAWRSELNEIRAELKALR